MLEIDKIINESIYLNSKSTKHFINLKINKEKSFDKDIIFTLKRKNRTKNQTDISTCEIKFNLLIKYNLMIFETILIHYNTSEL